MKFAFFTSNGFPWGGSEILWTAAAKEALKQNHVVLISIFDWPQQHASIEVLEEEGANLIYRRRFYPDLLTRIKKKLINNFLPSGKKSTYHEYLNRFKPDHILFNLAGGDEIATDTMDLMVFVKQTKIPFSVFYHSLSEQNYLSETIAENFIFVLQKAHYNFFTSQMQINLLQQHLGCSIDNARIINHPLRNIKVPAATRVDKVVYNLCIIGSLVTRWKGQDMVIRILAKDHWRSLNWHLNIYGDGADKEALLNLISEKKLTDKVTLHGHTEDVNNIFAENDMILIPSRQDSGPIVLFEAMLAAKPVVGTNMGAMPEYIQTGINGVLSKSTSEDAFEEAMQIAWDQKEQWVAWGRNAFDYLPEHYDFGPAQTLLNLITKVQ